MSGEGGDVVKGHVGRIVGRFEGIAQNCEQDLHECAHRSPVAIDSDQNYDGDDDAASTHYGVKSPIESPTHSQQQQPADKNQDRQQQLIDNHHDRQ